MLQFSNEMPHLPKLGRLGCTTALMADYTRAKGPYSAKSGYQMPLIESHEKSGTSCALAVDVNSLPYTDRDRCVYQ